MLTIEKIQAGKTHQFQNNLIHETSPYLLQHAHNPVNWFSWGEEAFQKAKKENKPILLSVGYSTCHWCHVMEHESFEDLEVARVMNENYVSIKVDREQRPDVDALYMTVVQSMTGHGGWPMTVWLTPDLTPFYGGTYFPAREGDRGRQPGFIPLLQRLADLYRDHPTEIQQRAKEIAGDVAKHLELDQSGNISAKHAFDRAFANFEQNYDTKHGGFGYAPKFPRPSSLQFLFHYGFRTGNPKATGMATGTLEGMLKGGIYDQIGGGFHRYSVDPYWLVPHFEKMLYDQSQITLSLLDAYQITGNSEFRRVAHETLDYVKREMTNPQGGFYSATDADSEGEEGKFFVWSHDEIMNEVGERIGPLFCEYYGVTKEGNFEGQNILFIQETLESFAKKKNMDFEKLSQDFSNAKSLLYKIRAQRIPPLTDDKIITAWNGLMIAAFARASLVLNQPEYLVISEKAAEFVFQNLFKDNQLHRSFRNGKLHETKAFLDDYACLVFGFLELFEITGNIDWFARADKLQTQLIQNFWDPKGGFYSSSDKLFFAREKPFYDGAEPSGNSIAAFNLLRFSSFLKDGSYREYAEKIFHNFAQTIETNPIFLPQMLVALDYDQSESWEIILVDCGDKIFDSLQKTLSTTYIPNRVILRVRKDLKNIKEWNRFPSIHEKCQVNVSIGYVCEGYVCQAPATDSEIFQKTLKRVRIPT